MSKDQVEKSVETEDQKAAREYANDECFLEGTPVWRDKHEAFLAGCRHVHTQLEAAGDCAGMCEKQALLEGSADWEEACGKFTQERDDWKAQANRDRAAWIAADKERDAYLKALMDLRNDDICEERIDRILARFKK